MEVDEIHQKQGCKFPRIGGDCNNEIGQKGEDQYPDDEEDGELRMSGGGNGIGVGSARFCGWPTSRIVRVSRASGGKDRHSKVLTSKGLRDRRVRLSVTTAIQFYDLQDRLGYDQPSKAVEWLLKAAAKSIDELPCINTSFPDTPKQLSDEKRSIGEGVEHGFDSAEVELDGDNNYQHQHHHQQQQHVSLSKSACSSNSETSKGSSLSRSERHIKARERAKERRAGKEKERETESRITNPQNANPISRSSFTELLTGGINNVNSNSSSNGETNLVQKSSGQWSSAAPMDYFSSGLLALSSSSPRNHHSSGFQLGDSLPPHSMFSTVSGDHHHHHHHQEMQHFSFNPNPDPDHHHHLIPVMNAAGSGGGSEYNLNFTISSPSSTSPSLAGFNRGTLQSNSPSLLPHLQRLSSTIDGSNSNLPFFIGTASPNAAPVENHNHHHYPDGGLQLCYGGDGGNRHSDHKGKGKN